MSERRVRGLAAVGGIAVGRALVLREATEEDAGAGGEKAQRSALDALARVASELAAAAEHLRAQGLGEEADILDANALIARDPGLIEATRMAAAEVSAAAAVRRAAETQALTLESLVDPLLAARGADVREIGRRAARILSGRTLEHADAQSILIARDLGPADVADLQLGAGPVAGIALAFGAVTSHAAIMARALGVPMVVALGPALLDAEGGPAVLDGDDGTVVLDPAQATIAAAQGRVRAREDQLFELRRARGFPAQTRDGAAVRLLCNAGTETEVVAGLAAGAEGIGLLRTELAFLDADRWPSEGEHVAVLVPALAHVEGRVATVRTFDFGADKTPPFLVGEPRRGIELALAHETALSTQLRAILRAGAATELRLLLPLVEEAAQVRATRALVADAARAIGWTGALPGIGAMIETPAGVRSASEIALEADFLSIGTNDLVQYALGLDRELPLASARTAADPVVLRLVRDVVAAAERTGLSVEVCGEAAGEPQLAALLVGLGVGELSVAPARVDEVRDAVRSLTLVAAAEAANAALGVRSAAGVLAIAAELLSGQAGDQRGEVVGGLGGVAT
jgi:phosphoenolpyruvate-protein kinase (PTS system EI component)